MRLTARNLTAERGGETVFENVSFVLAEGGALVVTGPNGTGKSTLLKVVAGLLPAMRGTVELDGNDPDQPSVAAICHYLGHQNAMKTALTVAENLAFWRGFLGVPAMEAEDALAAVGLPDIGHLPYAYLSAGQRRRVAIARLLASHRPLWILDEPTAGLDAASERQFAALMQAHRANGGMVLAATHVPLGLEDAAELRMTPSS
ncbi:MAG TPA: heme ABC exporter ATP-binding protein CcmA [Rhizobiaceae bacterium]|nr:heme ABC exporter ATP-binding protein CcmA [Rhizobiaceae bacterium]